MLLKTFLKQYINEENVEDIIFHSGNVIIKDTIKTTIFLSILYGLFYGVQIYTSGPMITWAFGIIGLILLVRYATQVFDKYVDCIVIGKDGITFFARDALRKYKTDFFGRDSIETISHEQNSLGDKLLFKGKIKIQLEHEIIYDFEEVNNPKKQVKKIMKFKTQYHKQKEKDPNEHKHSPINNEDQISILSEALSDVIQDYLEKKH